MNKFWVFYDFTRLVSGVALLALFFVPGSPDGLVIGLMFYVVFGLAVSFFRYAEGGRHENI